ncbi:MAG: acyloxyacyl hydrolase [bacterium]
MNYFKCLNILLVFVLLPIVLKGQEQDKSIFNIGVSTHYGFIIKHSKKLDNISQGYPYGLEANIQWHLRNQEVWNYSFCYPRAGFSLLYINFDNPSQLGYAIAVPFFVEPFFFIHNKLNFSSRFGIGPTFNNKVYHEQYNPSNLFLSSHVSFVVLLNFAINYRITNQLTSRLILNYNHISNGGIKNPNLGINFPTLSLGLDYSFLPNIFRNRVKDGTAIINPKKDFFTFSVFSAMKSENKVDKKHLVFGGSANYSKMVGRINALTAGLEFVKDNALKFHIEKELIEKGLTRSPGHERVAFLLGHEFLLGRFTFSQQAGIYLYSPYPARNLVYQRYGLNFNFGKMFMGINVKAHMDNADFIDIRTGIRF